MLRAGPSFSSYFGAAQFVLPFGQRITQGTQLTDLFRKRDKEFRRCLRRYETDGGNDGEEGQEIFKYCVTGIVLAGRLDIASDSDIMGSGYFFL